MPLPLLAVAGISAGVSALGGLVGGISAGKAKRRAERLEAERRKEMDRLKDVYSSISTTNPFLNMENVYEDLTINQQAAQFEAQQFQQSQANILGNLRGAAGGSGISALAQSLAQQGQLAAQRASADIASQENRLQQLRAGEASRIQGMERQGELESRRQQRELQGTLLGMSQSEVAAAREQGMLAQQAKFNAISSGFEGVANAGLNYMGAQAMMQS